VPLGRRVALLRASITKWYRETRLRTTMSNGVGGGPLFDEPTDPEPIGIGPAVDELMDGTGEAVEGEDHVDRVGRQRREVLLRRVHRDDVAGAGEHDVGVAPVIVVAGPVPNPLTVDAVLRCLLHREPLQLRLLVDDDDGEVEVDQRSRAQAVVGHRQQTVRVRWQVDPSDLAPLGDDVLKQAGP
jgi:hypothetical protein